MLRKLHMLLAAGMATVALPAAAQDPYDQPPSLESDADDAPLGGQDSAGAAGSGDLGDPSPPSESEAEPEGAQAGEAAGSAELSATASGSEDLEASQEAGVSAPAAGIAPTLDQPDIPGQTVESKGISKGWDVELSGYFRAPMALGISQRPGPDDLTGPPETQISYGPNRTVDANYFSFAYTRLQEQDWVELFVHVKKKHIQATVGWLGYWLAAAGFRNPDSAWVPGIAYLTLDTDLEVGKLKPNVALSLGSFWPKFGRFEKYDTYTLAMYRHLGEQLKLTLPVGDKIEAALVQGFGTGRDGSFNIVSPPPYQSIVGINLLHYVHLGFKYDKWLEIGLHHNVQWTQDPNLHLQSSGEKSYSNVREAQLMTIGGEAKVSVPRFGSAWVSPSFIPIKNGWALGEAGVEVVHGLSPEGLAVNYLGWSGSPADSTGSGQLLNLGFLYENTLSNVLGKPAGKAGEVTLNVFGLMVDSLLDRPAGSSITQNKISQFKYGADVEYNPLTWLGIMARFDEVNYDVNNAGYVFSAITGRLSFYTHFLSGERIYLQYSRYRYGNRMNLAGNWPWGTPLVAGSDILQGGPYAGSKPDMDVVRLQADIHF